jgi:hypothetical protein
MIEFIRGACTADRTILTPAAWKTVGCGGEAGIPVLQDELHSGARVLQVHKEVPCLLDHPRLDGVLGGAEDPDRAGAVLDDGQLTRH